MHHLINLSFLQIAKSMGQNCIDIKSLNKSLPFFWGGGRNDDTSASARCRRYNRDLDIDIAEFMEGLYSASAQLYDCYLVY